MSDTFPSPADVSVRHHGDSITFALTEPAARELTLPQLQRLAAAVGDAVEAFFGRILGDDRETGEIHPLALVLGLGLILGAAGGVLALQAHAVVLGMIVGSACPASWVAGLSASVVAENRANSPRHRVERVTPEEIAEDAPEPVELVADAGSVTVGIVVAVFVVVAPVFYGVCHLFPAVTR